MSKVKVIEWINFGIFPGLVMFSVGNTHAELIKRLHKKDMDKVEAAKWLAGLRDEDGLVNSKLSAGCAMRRVIENKKSGQSVTLFYLILKRFDLRDTDDFVSLAHECLHLCQFYLPYVLDMSKEHEAEAYLHSHLMQQCLKLIKKAAK